MKIDYQLKHQIYGRSGSLWEMQADEETKTRVRGIVKQAGNATALAQLDESAASAIQTADVLVEDAYFRFVDGNFAVVGRKQTTYSHREHVLEDGSKIYVGFREGTGTSTTTPIANVLAVVSDDFLRSISADQGFLEGTEGRDWYLIPIPKELIPVVIEGRNGVHLTSGVDFLARNGYIATQDRPADILPAGLVRVLSAYKKSPAPNSYVLSAPTDRLGSKWLSNYTYKSQSAESFKRAAAEYAGLFVFPEADVVLSAQSPNADTWVYACASVGTVVIRYPHTPLVKGQKVAPGTIVSGNFEVVSKLAGGDEDLRRLRAEASHSELSLDGIFPVLGLSWDGVSDIYLDSVENTPGGDPIIRMHFGEAYGNAVVEKLWAWQRGHELQTGGKLWEALGSPTLPTHVDFWDILEAFYGAQLLVVLSAFHTPIITERLRRFVQDSRPSSTVCLVGLEADLPDGVSRDENGMPLVDYLGNYVVGDVPAGTLMHDFDWLTYEGSYLVYQ